MVEDEILSSTKFLKRTVKEHEEWRTRKTLNLISSENFASPGARSLLSSDLSNRYSARDRFYRGTKFTDEVEELAVQLAKKLFRAKFADVRPLSGHTCSMIVYMSLLRAGNRVVTCPPEHGGYPGSSALGLGPLLSLENLYFPYDPEKMNIIPSETRKLLDSQRPEMTVFGSSFIPFPYDIGASLPHDYEGIRVYDGSHVMGLIAGEKFQDPLREGCGVLIGSTHKSFFGPQGGLILSNEEELFSKIDSKIYPGIVDNIHWNRVASLAFALIEMLKFGKEYAAQIIRNSKALAKALHDLAIPVKCERYGFTESHQVLLGYDEKESIRVANLLQNCDIITDVGIRLGTSEVTRRGMKEEEMEEIASLISDAVKGKSRKKVTRQVHGLMVEFGELKFCLT